MIGLRLPWWLSIFVSKEKIKKSGPIWIVTTIFASGRSYETSYASLESAHKVFGSEFLETIGEPGDRVILAKCINGERLTFKIGYC